MHQFSIKLNLSLSLCDDDDDDDEMMMMMIIMMMI